MNPILINCPLFKGLTLEELENILSKLNAKPRSYPKESIIKLSQDECTSLIIIEDGIVRGEMTDISGKVLKVEDITAPNAIASAFLFGKNNRFPVNVIANTDCKLLVISKPDFLHIPQENQKILINYLNMISNKAQFLSTRLNILSLKDLRSKIAHYLLQQTQNGRVINFTMPQNQSKLADFLGVARPSLARALKQLVSDGIIETNRNDVKILKIEELKKSLR